jgi:hypothetical protein
LLKRWFRTIAWAADGSPNTFMDTGPGRPPPPRPGIVIPIYLFCTVKAFMLSLDRFRGQIRPHK